MNRSILVSVLTLGAAACGGDEPGALPETEGTAVRVTVSAAAEAPGLESFPASVTAGEEARVATRTSGRIREITVEAGMPVRRGQPLVLLDGGDVQAGVDAAQAQATLAERSFRRVENLARDGAASQQELDEARARLEAARAQLSGAEAQRAYVTVRAPFDGFVTARMADPGDMANPGQPILALVGNSDLEVVADLPSEWAGRIGAGTEVRVVIPSEGRVETARIVRVVPALQAGSRRFRVEAVFEPGLGASSGIVPGAYARIELPGGSATGTRWIPGDAVVRRGQLTGVFAVEPGPDGSELRLRWLRLGRERDGAVEVLAGPAGPLTVVRAPSSGLRDGQSVAEATVEPWSMEGSELRADVVGDSGSDLGRVAAGGREGQ